MASITPQPLNLPEILRITFVFLDNKSLVACAQVNSLWADEATDVLWQEPPISALARLVPSGRAQTYANKITRLYRLDWRFGHNEYRQVYQRLLYPRLIKMSGLVGHTTCLQGLVKLLQPSLIFFRMELSLRLVTNPYEYSNAMDAFFMQLSTRCPNLRIIKLVSWCSVWNGLLKFLEASPSLQSIELQESWNLTNEVIQHLAARPNLTKLEIPGAILGEAVAQVEANTESPFADLKRFNGTVDEATLLMFSRHTRKLKTLKIAMYSPSANLLSTLSRFSALRILEVRFHADKSAIAALGLITLAKGCQRLTEISFHGGGELGSNLTDADICQLSSLLPDLMSIDLGCCEDLSVQSVHFLGRNCPRLRYCQLCGCVLDVSKFLEYPDSDTTTTSGADSSGFDQSKDTIPRLHSTIMQNFLDPLLTKSESIGESRLLFPKLKFLEVEEFINSRNVNVTTVVSHLLSEAPQLLCFHASSGTLFSGEVNDAFRQLKSDRLNAKQARTNT